MKGKKEGLGAFCYLAVFAMALLALPALLWFCRRGAGEEVALPVVMYHRVCENEEDADEYTGAPPGLRATWRPCWRRATRRCASHRCWTTPEAAGRCPAGRCCWSLTTGTQVLPTGRCRC